MIEKSDIQQFEIPADVLEQCKTNPVPGCSKPVTGQLKAIGDYVLRQVVGFEEEAFNMQLESAREMGVSCVCEDPDKRIVGLSTTVSLIKDHDVIDKNVVVPSGQIRKHQNLDAHHTVAVFVVGARNEQQELSEVRGVYAAGWIPVFKLKSHVKPGGSGAFQVKNMKLATAPVTILNPLPSLMTMVRWHHACV